MNLLLLALLSGSALPAGPVTFNKQIAPILFENCAPCHRPGQIGPFPLLSYQQVHRHASQIAFVTQTHFMPPWPPAAGFGDFVGTRRLTALQIEQIGEWVREGAPEGDPKDLPPTPHFTEGWQLGPPDLILQMPQAYRLAAGGTDIFRNFVVPVNLSETKFVRAIELRPGDMKLIHHANVLIDSTGNLRRRDGIDGQPGFPGMDLITESGASFDPDAHFLFWKPGSPVEAEPLDMGWRLDPGTDLIVNLHLQPSGKPEWIQPSIGLYFSRQAPTRFPMLLQLEHDGAIDIPPGSRDFSVADHLTLPVDVQLLRIYPHAHYLGKQIEAWATLPDGKNLPLIKIEDWDINWQAVYTCRHPVFLPKGSTVSMRISYDNTTANPRNPNHPPKRVRTGDLSTDEMGHVWLQVLPKMTPGTDPRLTLQEALMRRRLEKYPADFVANYNLGALLERGGEHREALGYLEKAVAQEPKDATARNAFAAALLDEHRLNDAITQLRKALEIDPEYADAQFNLARALLAEGDSAGAIAEYTAYLEKKPDDADAHIHLGSIYLAEQQYEKALPQFREAAKLRPNDADVQCNLGSLLAMHHDLPGAIAAYQAALKIDPNHRTARANLARAQAQMAASQLK